MRHYSISIVVPVYNSENTIEELVNRISDEINKCKYINEFEIILINDGSKDHSHEICLKLAENNKLLYINFTKNFGQHHALLCGYRYAKSDLIIKIDDDLQVLPEEIPVMIEGLIKSNADVAFAKFIDKKQTLFRLLGGCMNNIMARFLLNKPKGITISSFYLMKDYVVDNIIAYKNPYPYIAGLIFGVTDNVVNILINHADRKEGKSNYTFRKLLSLWFNGFVNFSVKPLRIVTSLGILVALGGAIYSFYLIIQRLMGNVNQAGWVSTIAAIFFIGGLQLVSIGFVGEYIGRIFISLNNLPQYVIKEIRDERQ
ncbi:MAG: glycosyltransferase family 2 protein [Eubacteriaceae bacterium]